MRGRPKTVALTNRYLRTLPSPIAVRWLQALSPLVDPNSETYVGCDLIAVRAELLQFVFRIAGDEVIFALRGFRSGAAHRVTMQTELGGLDAWVGAVNQRTAAEEGGVTLVDGVRIALEEYRGLVSPERVTSLRAASERAEELRRERAERSADEDGEGDEVPLSKRVADLRVFGCVARDGGARTPPRGRMHA